MCATGIMDSGANFIYQHSKREGQCGLEVDIFSGHYSRITPAYGCSLVKAVLRALEDADAHAPAELNAAVTIQATFRMYRHRKAFLTVRHHACLIQRVYRGYITRKHLEVERATVRQMAYLQAVFDMFATRIQACYRGYQSRKTRSNYYAQQAYLKAVTALSSEVLAQAHNTQVEQDAVRNAEARQLQELLYARRTARMHYMVSTCSLPSVYQGRVGPPSVKQSSQPVSETGRELLSGSGESGFVSAAPQTVKVTAKASDGGAADGKVLMAPDVAGVSGSKLEDDIRYNARVARRERSAVKAKTSHALALPTAIAASSSQSPERKSAGGSEAEGATPSTAPVASGTRLPPVTPSKPTQSSRQANAAAPEAAVTVPWELASTRPPHRPLTTHAPFLASSSFSHTAPPVSCASKAGRKPRAAPQGAQDGCWHVSGTCAAAASGPARSAAGVDSSIPGAAVSSFHRRFAVKRHDCLEHGLSSSNGVVSDGGGSHAVGDVLSLAKEDAAIQRSVDQKVIQALHGDAIFKVPARRGRR
ncbi:hypothetical protein LSCM1_00439 [Leishmania martiniquensis]|uniref:IQ calmodulin-binding motif family protein n=1 Tax=Leishmania martiniquensis TaxID=1580590 RepID=A0A836KG30_9TRYP|nr:hypothetical protein LSCM1_00439 [Leishmania martiniquensis]